MINIANITQLRMKYLPTSYAASLNIAQHVTINIQNKLQRSTTINYMHNSLTTNAQHSPISPNIACTKLIRVSSKKEITPDIALSSLTNAY